MRRTCLVPCLVVFLLACSSSTTGTSGTGSNSGKIDAASVCDKSINECGETISQADCEKTFGALRVSQDCLDLFASASCDDLTKDGSQLDTTCFPPCSDPGAQSCNGDGTITLCSKDKRTFVADCAATCEVGLGKAYSGTCGTSFGGQVSEEPKCWCQ